MNTARAILEIGRHELAVIFRTKRAVAIVSLYLGLALLGGVTYVLTVRVAEQKAIELFESQGMTREVAEENMRLTAQKGYDQLAMWLAGVDDVTEVDEHLRSSVILPVFFWCSLVLLPFLILLTSFDQLSSDLGARSLCYSILRAPRAAIVLGKVLGHTVIFTVLSAVSSVALVLVASLLLESVDFGGTLVGLVRMWVMLVPFGLAYLGISSFASAANTQPTPALISAVALVIGLRVVGWLRHVPEESDWAPLRHARWVSPATYHDGMWLTGLSEPALSAVAYLCFAAVFVTASILIVRARDL